MMDQQVSWNGVGLRMVQGLTTTIEVVRQLDVQEASLVMRLLGKSCTRMVKDGVGHQFGIALIETSGQLAMKETLNLEDVLKLITGILGRLYFTAKTDEERLLVAQLEAAVKNYQVV
ncbi:MAG TPA: recombinase [Desulfosporosinus sp.]|nr:recombinase [Desulfosporosinus sp.]